LSGLSPYPTDQSIEAPFLIERATRIYRQLINHEEGSMPRRDYSVAPVLRLHELSKYRQLSDISARRRLRYQDQADIDLAPKLPADAASYELDDRSEPSVSSF
jgi:hypothetical protein